MEEVGNLDLKHYYRERIRNPDQYLPDIRGHMAYLLEVAHRVDSVIEFGCRTGNSTTALVHGMRSGGVMHSYDIQVCKNYYDIKALAESERKKWVFVHDRSENCDKDAKLVFFDSWHSYHQVKAELDLVKKMKLPEELIFHDTELFGWFAQRRGVPGTGILPAILEFMCSDHRIWNVFHYSRINNGLLHLSKIL